MSGNAIESPETYHHYEDKLADGNNLFQCNKCGHYVGDPRSHNWIGTCPDCHRIGKFFRIIA
jgi:rubrerythrin